jgi:NAD dependent epimerase/dehydratase family enzyme
LEGVYNAVSPNPVSNAVLTKTIAKVLKKPLWLPNVPEFVMKLILGEMAYLLFSSKNLSADKIQSLGFQFHFPEAESALRDLYQ